MCGIAGILTPQADADDQRRVVAMQHALRHRGPDDGGTWQSASRQATLGHTRLAILDLSTAGHQPMSAAGRWTITFNGEIYNFKELRRTLEQRGLDVRSQSDTEVILRAYQAFGESCVEHLRGMFALAIWDEQERTCLLARDRFGIIRSITMCVTAAWYLRLKSGPCSPPVWCRAISTARRSLGIFAPGRCRIPEPC